MREATPILVRTRTAVFGAAGRLHGDASRPALVAVTGSFPPPDFQHELIDRFTDASVFVVHLPGMGGTVWTDVALPEMAEGFKELLYTLAPDRRIVLMGSSTGNLLTLGVDVPAIVHRIALEPFFRTRDLWPFIAYAHERLALNPDAPKLRTFLWRFFGIREGEAEVEDRDYRHLLQNIRQPTEVIAGGMPLMPQRRLPEWPSLLAAEYREALRDNPLVTLHEGPPDSGHGYGSTPGPGRDFLHRVIADVLGAERLD